ncbi:MAG: DUF4276 family protein [Burkholderiales bacterium]|nr:DUF4276 family protein [Burkholderiales bacterium]
MGNQCYWWQTVINLCFVVEGYAEENFVNHKLSVYLQSKVSKTLNIDVQNLKGGILYSELIDRLRNIAPQYNIITTLIDLVGLGAAKLDNYSAIMASRNISSQDKSLQVQQLIADAVSCSNVIPYVQPHEFEALCFADIEALAQSDPLLAKNKIRIEQILQSYASNPENINTTPSKYPAKQLEKFAYTKGASNFALYCDVDKIKAKCPHFNRWINQLSETLSLL